MRKATRSGARYGGGDAWCRIHSNAIGCLTRGRRGSRRLYVYTWAALVLYNNVDNLFWDLLGRVRCHVGCVQLVTAERGRILAVRHVRMDVRRVALFRRCVFKRRIGGRQWCRRRGGRGVGMGLQVYAPGSGSYLPTVASVRPIRA